MGGSSPAAYVKQNLAKSPRAPALPLLLFAAALLCAIPGQPHAANPRIGFLAPGTPEGSALVLSGLRRGLQDHGYSDGVNLTIEARYANDQFDRLPGLARELADVPVDVMVAFVTQTSLAAKQAAGSAPVVMIGVSDPVASGLVTTLSRPGANVTGTSAAFTGLVGKGVQLLRELDPGVDRVAVLWNPSNRVFQAQMLDEIKASARQLGVRLQVFEARDLASIETAFAAMAKERIRAVSVLPDPVYAAHWPRIASLAASSRLYSVTVTSSYAEAGGLMTYGPSLVDLARVSAGYVAKILNGAKPGQLAVEQPTKFELVINLKTAREIGVMVPQPLRLREDRLIE